MYLLTLDCFSLGLFLGVFGYKLFSCKSFCQVFENLNFFFPVEQINIFYISYIKILCMFYESIHYNKMSFEIKMSVSFLFSTS